MKKFQWIIDGNQIVVASKEQIQNWAEIQKQLGNHFHADCKDLQIEIYRKEVVSVEEKGL